MVGGDLASCALVLKLCSITSSARALCLLPSCFKQIESFSLNFHGHELVSDTTLELNYGRYALRHQSFHRALQAASR